MKINKDYISLIFLFIVACFWIVSCRHETIFPDNIPEICFESEVLPIFQNSCGMAGCHDGQGESEIVLTNYVEISHSVVSGKPYNSPAYKAIIAKSGEGRMPPDKPLSPENRTIIRFWIEQGAGLTICPDTATQGSDYINPRACFSRDILPVLVSSCAMTGCHDAVTHKEGYVFTSYTTTLMSVKPGNPGSSKLYKVITTSSGEDRMPPLPKSPLASAAIDSIRAWISYGALNEACGEVCDTINPVTFSGTIWPIIQTSCTGCHSGTAPSGNVAITNYNNVATIASNGVLMNALKGSGVPRMPPSGSFSACRIRQFGLWINNGYLYNK